MNGKLLISFLVMGFSSVLCAQNIPYQNDLLWVTTPDHKDWLYSLGEEATVTVSLYKYGIVQDEMDISYSVGSELMPYDNSGTVKLKNGVARISLGTMDEQGFRDCKMSVTIDGTRNEHHIKVGFEPNKLKPYTRFPDDFTEFWTMAKNEAAQCPMEVTRTYVPDYSTTNVDCYLIKLQTYKKGQYIYMATLHFPRKEGKYPIVFSPPGAGIKPMNPLKDIFYVEAGFIRFDMEIHGIRPDLDAETYLEISRAFGNRNNSYLVNVLEKQRHILHEKGASVLYKIRSCCSI
jgi:hypothetical protein